MECQKLQRKICRYAEAEVSDTAFFHPSSPIAMQPVTPSSPRFVRLSLANLAAQSAEQLSLATVPLVAVLVLGSSVGDIGLLTAMGTLPFLLLSLPLGTLADRLPRQQLMLWGELLRLIALLLMLAALHSAQLQVGWLAVLSFVGAIGTVAFSVATPGLVSELVPRSALAQANARLEVARSMAFASGPAVAGSLVAWAGGLPTMALAVALSGLAVFALFGLRPAATVAAQHLPERSRPKRHLLAEVVEGVRFVRQHALLMPLLLTGAVFNLAWFILQTAFVPYAIHHLGMGADAVGLTMACYGAGMLAGALASPRLIAALPFGRAVQLGPVAGLAAAACLAATLLWPSAALAALCFFLLGSGPMVWSISTTTLRQHVTPHAMLGRVSSVFLTVNAGARPIGAALGGWVGMGWGEGTCLLVALAGFAVQVGVIVVSPFSGLRRLPQERAEVG